MAEEMEDRNSWNEMIFRQIKVRSDWLSALIWRKQLTPVDDITEKDDEDLEAEKKDLDPEDQRFIDWCDGRQANFNNLFNEEAASPVEKKTGGLNRTSQSGMGNSKLPDRKNQRQETMSPTEDMVGGTSILFNEEADSPGAEKSGELSCFITFNWRG